MCRFESLFTHLDYGEGIIGITAPMGERMYLVLGDEKAALIDTGMGVDSLLCYVRKLTSLPLIVINTHGHPDHAGGNSEFDRCRMHSFDLPWFQKMCGQEYRRSDIGKIHPDMLETYDAYLLPDAPEPHTIDDGEFIDLGGRCLETMLTPGHTPGSLCLYDGSTGSLFAGDMISGQNVWLYDSYSVPLKVYYQTLCLLEDHFPHGKWCFTGHNPGRLDFSALSALKMCARRILMQDAAGTPIKTFAGQGLHYQYGSFGIIYNPDNLY